MDTGTSQDRKMRQLHGVDVLTIPAMIGSVTKKSLISGAAGKSWIPAGLLAIFTGIGSVFGELFFVVLALWLLDLLIGLLRAFHDPGVDIEWIKVFRSFIKLAVIGLAVGSMHYIERFIFLATGVDTGGKLCVATIIVIGSAEAFSILDNLVYFNPRLGQVAEKVKELLGKGKNNGSDR